MMNFTYTITPSYSYRLFVNGVFEKDFNERRDMVAYTTQRWGSFQIHAQE